jgi:predicted DNA-binding transcriptional regulator AlpA
MNETPMLFPMTPGEFWKQIRTTIEEVVNEKLNKQAASPPVSHLPEKALLKAAEVCAIFRVSKPTLYDWLKQNKLKSFKIKSRRYFSRIDIEAIILQTEQTERTKI